MREQSCHTAGFQMSLPRIVEGRGADSVEWSMFAGSVCTGREDWLFLLSLLHGPFLRHSSVPCGHIWLARCLLLKHVQPCGSSLLTTLFLLHFQPDFMVKNNINTMVGERPVDHCAFPCEDFKKN